jgi:plastocyanin
MKKSLLFLALLFSLWSFAVIKFNVGTSPMFGSEATKPVKAKSVALKNKNAAAKRTTAGTLTTPPLTPAQYPLPKDSQWSYLDTGVSLDAVNWKTINYNNTAWAVGNGPLGYGDASTTVISYGPDAANKYITTYFSRDIEIDLADMADTVEFGMRRDDGAIVYINGVEVIRDNMPAGAFDYLTNSTDIIDGANEKRYYTFHLPKTVFTQGVNRIAVEIHNRDGQSSDLGFDMYVRDAAPEFVCEEGHIGCFTSIVPGVQIDVLRYPEEHRFQLIHKQGTAYLDGSGNIPGNHDFTGYIPVAGSSTNGYLSINHENSPGGVSIVDFHLDETSQLWVVDDSRKVDLYNTDLVTTTRNCSGGITPWGTVITAEESTSAGDVNGDGYQDEGWLVEIDPVTAEVKEYGNGKQEKLWAMGRMNHENVVVTANGTTAYYGEDGGSHCVYKFVADTPNDLSSGTLYVLKLNLGLSNDEPSSSTATWVQVPNTTQADRNNVSIVAGTLLGTNFNGVEDCEISPLDGKIYFTSKGKNRIYRFKDNGATISEFETFAGGMSYTFDTVEGPKTEPWADGNDNLTFDDKGNLWVCQDGGLNYIWVIRPNHTQGMPKVLLHSSMPDGSEPTGLTFSPDHKYGFFSVQHPNGDNLAQQDATFTDVNFNASASVIFSNQQFLGPQTPLTDFAANQVQVEEGETVTFTDMSTNTPTSWAWTFEGGTPATSIEQNPTVTYAEAGTYNVTLTTSNVAGTNEAVKNDYIIVEEALGVNTPGALANIVSLYPNPTNGIVTVALNDEACKNVNVEVVDFLGRKVAETKTQTTGAGQKIELNLTKLAGEQVFIIKVQVGDKSGSYKMLKVN